jgi:two-component system, OmpR family, sensor histidine kinase CiaH
MKNRLERVNVEAFRVAAITVGIVAIAYTLVSVVIVMYVNNSLVSQVDQRLQSALGRIVTTRVVSGRVAPGSSRDPLGSTLGAPLHAWVEFPDGTVATPPEAAVALPAQAARVSSPSTVTIDGDEVRLVGAPVGDDYVVLGQSLAGVAQARNTTIVAEGVAGAVLLVLVFVGALLIGRRVGAPFELARQRQMEFTADASHELRTPLSVIEAQTSLALTQQRDPAWYRSAFQRVGNETRRMRQLVEDMLWLARVDSTEARPEAEPVDLGVLARSTVDRFGAVAEARGVRLSVTVAEGAHVVVGSATWLDRLVGVLLDNACKYAGQNGQVAVTVASADGRVRLSVDDSGPGIPEQERPRILDRFHRATDQAGGSGLGLAIGDVVVRRSGGRWEMAGSPLGGASMAVSWPRPPAA